MGMKPPATLEPLPRETRQPSDPGLNLPRLDFEEGGPSKSYWWVWVLIFASIGYGCYRLYLFETSKKAAIASTKGGKMRGPREIPVVAASAHRGDMPVYLEGLGTVTAFNTVTVKPRVDGQLTSVAFKEGQFVHQGDILATIDPRPFQVALDQANGNMAQAEGNLKRDQASLRDAQINYERDQELFKEQIIAKQQLDTQLATADQIRGSIQADQAAIEASKSAIDNAKLNLTFTKISAPISGRIGLRQVDSGNMVHAADVTGLAVITQLQPISVLFTIPEDQLPDVLRRLTHGSQMRVEAYDRDQRKKLADGTLLTVDNQIDQTTGTSKLKAVFPNSDFSLFPNQFVNARLWLDTQKNVIIIPSVAIQRGPTGTFVYVVQEDGTVTVRAVKVGMSEGNDIAIDDGLQPGERVVVDGAEKLVDGMKVNATNGSGPRTAPSGGRGRRPVQP